METLVQFPANSVNVGNKRPLSKTEIAAAIGCAKSNLSKGRYKGMPKFYTLEEFQVWDMNTRQRVNPNTPPMIPTGEAKRMNSDDPIRIDWKQHETTEDNHLSVTLARADRISNMAWALVDDAVERGDLPGTFGGIRNWNAALDAAADIRAKYLQIQIDEREVIRLDEVKHVVGLVMQELITRLDASVSRMALKANPSDPNLALKVIQGEVDGVRGAVRDALLRIDGELSTEDGEMDGAA